MMQKDFKHPKLFGTGIVDGIAATEASNNGVTGGAIATMLTLGIPGSPVTAIMLGGLMMKGISPGPIFFETASSTAYTFIMSLFPANLVMLLLGLFGAKYFVKVVKCPNQVLISVILVLTVVGSYAVNNSLFDVFLMFGMGLLAYGMKAIGMSTMPAVLGFILGPIAEVGIRQTAIISQNDFTIFLTRPASLILIILIVISIVHPIYKERKRRRANVV